MFERVVLPVMPAMVPVARSVVRVLLGDSCLRAGDVLAVAGEFAAMAVRGPGPQFTVRVDVKTGWARVEVEAMAGGEDADEDVYRLSLLMLDGHADRWGRDRDGKQGTWWAEVFWEAS